MIFLVAAIAYAIISYITAVIVCLIDRCRRKNRDRDDHECFCLGSCNQNPNNNLLTISSDCNGEHGDDSCCNSNRINARVNVIPNSNTNGRTGCFCGNYRRR